MSAQDYAKASRAENSESCAEMTRADLGLDGPWDFWEGYSSYGPYSPAARIWHPKHWLGADT